MRTVFLLALSAGLLTCTSLRAAAPSARQAAIVFKAYDKNRDSVVSLDEWLAMKRVSKSYIMIHQNRKT